MKKIAILALQGSFVEHQTALQKAGAKGFLARTLEDVEKGKPDGIILPGGESTTMMMLLKEGGLLQWLIDSIQGGMPVMATCAGLILLSGSHLNLMDVEVDRNAYGSQLNSFEEEIALKLPSHLSPLTSNAIFIRAPRITKVGKGVEVLATANGDPVWVQEDNRLGLTFHPELCDDTTIHRYFIGLA